VIKVQRRDWHRVPYLVCRVYPKRTSLDKVEEVQIYSKMDREGRFFDYIEPIAAILYARTDDGVCEEEKGEEEMRYPVSVPSSDIRRVFTSCSRTSFKI